MLIDCPPVEMPDPPAWAEVGRVFSFSRPIPLRQHWKETPDDGLRDGEVRTAWTPSGLWVYAVLQDDDVFNEETTDNAYFFSRGDVFEIFVRPENQEAYFEFHVGPDNQQLRMRIPSAEAFVNLAGAESGSWKIAKPIMRSWVQRDSEIRTWRVLVFLPFDSLVESSPKDQDWFISFGRYDCTRGVKKPVLSSSSPHIKPGFHRQHEWARLRFSQETIPVSDPQAH